MSAGAAVIDMAAERGGPTARDRAQHGPLLHAEPRMPVDEGVTLRMEDVGHLHRRPAHPWLGFRFSRDRGRTTGGRHVQLLQGIRCGLQMARRQMQIHRRMRQIGVPEQDLDRAEIGAGFEQVRGIRMAEGVRTDATGDAGRHGRRIGRRPK